VIVADLFMTHFSFLGLFYFSLTNIFGENVIERRIDVNRDNSDFLFRNILDRISVRTTDNSSTGCRRDPAFDQEPLPLSQTSSQFCRQ
jgi:hypothetical protein